MNVQEILFNAYYNVPFYNHIYNLHKCNLDKIIDFNSLDRLPVFSKEDIRNYGILNFINCQALDSDYCINCENLEKTISSGTTGEPISVMWYKKDYLSSTFNHWLYRYKKFSITPSDVFFTSEKLTEEKDYIVRGENQYVINTKRMTYDCFSNIFDILNKVKPQWLYIQPSILYSLVRYSLEQKRMFPTSIRYIEFFSEPLLPTYMRLILSQIKVPYTNMYGCSETNGIAYECSEKKFHIMSKNVYVEIIKNGKKVRNGKTGNVCVTGLHNTLMPMIRYRLNDIARLSSSPCSCGNKEPILEILISRMPEFLIFDDLNICNEGSIFFPIERMPYFKQCGNQGLPFYIKRDSLEHYTVILDNNFCKEYYKWSLTKKISTIFREYGLEHCKIDYVFADKISKSLSKGVFFLNDC